MHTLYVYADLDWLDTPQLVGELFFETVRGSNTYGFAYDKLWLAEYGDLFLSGDLQNYSGIQYSRPERDIFSCFADALPDRWGRTLLNRREQIAAAEDHRQIRRHNSFDYLTGIDDLSRMGAFRFALVKGGDFINSGAHLRIPPLTNIGHLMHAAQEIEDSENRHQLPSKKWLDQLLQPGTSLGGARPKASVRDEDGFLNIAKFPSKQDTYDVGLLEHFCHNMARKCGLRVANTRTLETDRYHIFLSKRFDRTTDGKRIHFASALTMLGLNDGDNASNGYGYTDIVDFIIQQGCNVERNLEELFRRVAFYIIVGNSDDHFRNHGFLLTRKGWELSPAYDINPTLSEYQSLLINRSTSKADLEILAASASDYMLSSDRAESILNEVRTVFRLSWRDEARRLQIPKWDIEMFADRFNRFD